MNLKIDIIDRTVILYVGDKYMAEFKDVSSLEVKNFGRILEIDNVFTHAAIHYYPFSGMLFPISRGVSQQPYGYAVKDGEVMRIEGEGGAEKL